MRRLLLLRHAKSDWPPGIADEHRPLAPRGRRAAPKLGAYLADEALRPDRVLVSPALRARQTWELVAAAWAQPPESAVDARLYEHPAQTLLEAVRATGPQVRSLLLVSHNPTLEDFVHLMVGIWPDQARRHFTAKFPTAGLAVIELPVDDWSQAAPGTGRLDRFVTPALLGAATPGAAPQGPAA
ncbi:MAG TPA: histidine phosphatase family protein [Xanthobacteraceae bacterium]|nr:histidine phosphatase family protein [Xanthobacteraceae bacterium]